MNPHIASAMNNAKWEKIRVAMAGIEQSPGYRTGCINNGYISSWDYDWLYHFPIGGYKCIEWLEISCKTEAEKEAVSKALKKIHVPGKIIPTGFLIYGYIKGGRASDYI